MKITKELIIAGRSGNGGWSRAKLALIGVSWPPDKGWMRRAIGREINQQDAVKFIGGVIKAKAGVNTGHRNDMRGYADDSHQPVKTMRGELYFEISCDCLPWDGCMRCIPIVESRWGIPPAESFSHRQIEMGYE